MGSILREKLYIPAFSIIAAVLVLLLLIGTSTYRHLDRQKKRVVSFVHRQGATLIRSIEAGARVAVMTRTWRRDTAEALIREVARNEDVAYLYLVDGAGNILLHAGDPSIADPGSWKPEGVVGARAAGRMVPSGDGGPVYEIARRFRPGTGGPGGTGEINGAGKAAEGLSRFQGGDVIVVGVTMAAYEEARKSDLHHAFIMAGVVLVLGSGAFFFIFITQNYYLVDRTLKQTRDYANQIVESMSEGLVSIDLWGRVVSCNAQALSLLGFAAEEIQGRPLADILDAGGGDLERALGGCLPFPETEIRYVRPERVAIPLGISASPIHVDAGACSGSVLLIRDLREIKRLEERIRRSEKLAATGKLAAGIAHEIRNPLSSVRGFAQFLHHGLRDRPADREYAAIMVAEMDRINRVVSDLLSFASPRPAEPEPCDTGEIVDHVIRLVASEAEAADIRIEKHVGPNLESIPLDGYQMTQALLNLLQNALKFTGPGGRISVAARRSDRVSRLILTVEDDGAGIPGEHLPMLFDPFFTTHETGTGLGLAIVHQIVANHRGDIDVESPPAGGERGSRFVIRIPLGNAAGAPETAAEP